MATIHVHILHHTLDPLGMVFAALAVAAGVVLIALLASEMIREPDPPESSEPPIR